MASTDDSKIASDPASVFSHRVSMDFQNNRLPDYKWNDSQWKGISRDNRVIYEMHVGTFTPEGTGKQHANSFMSLPIWGYHRTLTSSGV